MEIFLFLVSLLQHFTFSCPGGPDSIDLSPEYSGFACTCLADTQLLQHPGSNADLNYSLGFQSSKLLRLISLAVTINFHAPCFSVFFCLYKFYHLLYSISNVVLCGIFSFPTYLSMKSLVFKEIIQ